MQSLFTELRRRNVVKVAVAYAIVAWLLIQIIVSVEEPLNLPDWTDSFIIVVLGIGFVVALLLSWAYELTPDGVERTKSVPLPENMTNVTGRKLDFAIIALLVAAVGFMFVENYVFQDDTAGPDAEAPVAATTSEAVGIEDISIAVLPFLSMSDDPEQEYFSDGISEELLNLLAHIPNLRVPSRTSSFSFKGQDTDLPTIAAALNVSHVLEGSVRKAGDEIRITAQLIEVATDSHLWSETYTRELTNVFTIQDEIAAHVVEALRIELFGEKVVVRDGYRTDNPDAHDAYLLGQHRSLSRNIEALLEAREFFQTAIDLDPDYAAAYAGLAKTYHVLHLYGAIDYDDAIAGARPALDRALELDPELSEAYSTRAFSSTFMEANAAAAEADFLTAIELNPNSSDAPHWHSQQLAFLQGRLEEGLAVQRSAVDIDPLSTVTNSIYGVVLIDSGRPQEGRAALNRSLEILPSFSSAHALFGTYDSALGQLDEALRRFHIAATGDPRNAYHPVSAGMIYIVLGDLERAQYLFDHAASLTGHRSTATFYEEFTALVLNRDNPARLITTIEAMPLVATRWQTNNEHLFRGAILQTGDLAAIRRYFERNFPNLVNSEESTVHFANYQPAADLAWLLRMEGESERSDRLLAAILDFLPQRPTDTGVAGRGSRGLTEAKVLAQQGDDTGALAALRRAVDTGWRNLWWMTENDPTLASISDHPEFLAIMDEIRADMAVQLERVREMERSGEISPWPGLATAE